MTGQYDHSESPMPDNLYINAAGRVSQAETCTKQIAEPSLQQKLELRRAKLARQLVEVDAALSIVYTDPRSAEQIYTTIRRAGM